MKIGLAVAMLASVFQLITGHASALVVAYHQPTKLAAMEGHFSSQGPADLHILGWVFEQQKETIGLAIPGGLSFLTYGSFNHPVTGLDAFAPDMRPPVNFVFQTYHIMVGIGMTLIALSLLGVWLGRKGQLWTNKPVLWAFVFSVLLPQIANQTGWWTACVGRQPWIVHGLMKTADGTSDNVSADHVLASIVMFSVIYAMLFILFLYLLDRKIKRGPVFSMANAGDDVAHDPRLTIQSREGDVDVL
jgi:cytochrome d ubiquinol oxidase subunit I